MTAGWLAAVCLFGAAVITGWPGAVPRARRRAIIGRYSAGSEGRGHRPQRAFRDPIQAIRSYASAAPRRAMLVATFLAGSAGAIAGGPVAAIAATAYGGLTVRTMLRRQSDRAADRAHRNRLDGLCALAADLRAGLAVQAAMPAALSADPLVDPLAERANGPMAPPAAAGRDRIAALTGAAVRLAEQTGAPLADLVERIEADARAMARGLAAAEAQAAGAQATAWLLAGLPLGGIALGYSIGADPLHILLHTPVGAGCAVGAIILQLAGLAWTDRLSGGATRAA